MFPSEFWCWHVVEEILLLKRKKGIGTNCVTERLRWYRLFNHVLLWSVILVCSVRSHLECDPHSNKVLQFEPRYVWMEEQRCSTDLKNYRKKTWVQKKDFLFQVFSYDPVVHFLRKIPPPVCDIISYLLAYRPFLTSICYNPLAVLTF